MPEWIGLSIVIGAVTVILGVYMLITKSAGIYATPRHFRNSLLASAAISYLLSGGLFLFVHLDMTVAIAVSAIVPFLVGNLDLGGNAHEEPAATGEEVALDAQKTGDEAEDEALDDGADDQVLDDERDRDEAAISHPGEIEPFWN